MPEMREHYARQAAVGLCGERTLRERLVNDRTRLVRHVRRPARRGELPELTAMQRAGLLVAACTLLTIGYHASAQPSLLEPKSIATPAAPNSAQPQLTVSSHGVLLSWIER